MRGVPLRIEMGPRDIENGVCVLVRRDTNEKIKVKLTELDAKVGEILELIQQNMYDVCKKRMEAKTTIAHNLDEFQANMNKEQGFIKAIEQEHIGDTCVCCGKPATKMVIWGRQY